LVIAPDSSAAARDLPTPGKLGRNSPCPCGSGNKYKHCCLVTQRWTGNVLGDPHALGERRLQQFVAYANKTYHLRRLLESLSDGRCDPNIPTLHVAAATFFCGLLRVRSFNALEPKMKERPFISLVDPEQEVASLGSVDTVSRVLGQIEIDQPRNVTVSVLAKAERNKIFRDGWHGALRYVAIDGWEPISSFSPTRRCEHCLVRHVKVKQADGTVKLVEQYYHRYVVAMLIDERLDLVVGLEPILPADLRPGGGTKDNQDEGELTAAKRLLRRVKQTFNWVDVVIADGLYPNGPFLSLVKDLRMGAVIIARKPNDEPLKEALHLWGNEPPREIVVDEHAGERRELWDCPDLETLDTYKGPIRVVRGRVTKIDDPKAPPHIWCMVVVGKATKLTAHQVLAVARGRWHIENTAFNQWTQYWKFTHVFTHNAQAIQVLYWLFIAAFNLLTLFLYRQLRSYGRDRGKDVTRTISRLIDQMLDDLARLTASPWDTG
jgi:hypothetical protein